MVRSTSATLLLLLAVAGLAAAAGEADPSQGVESEQHHVIPIVQSEQHHVIPVVQGVGAEAPEDDYLTALACPASAPGTPGGFSDNTDTEVQAQVDAAIFSQLLAAGSVQLPPGASCDTAQAVVTPGTACSQVVAGTHWIVSFEVTFPDCPWTVHVEANAMEALPADGAPLGAITVSNSAVDVTAPPSSGIIPVWGQCGGGGDGCAAAAEKMGASASDFCGNKDWPNTSCEDGSECMIDSVWYRQCRPYAHDLNCPVVSPTGTPGVSGAFSPVTDAATALAVDTAIWANLTATGQSGMLLGTKCADPATITPKEACSQVVAGTNYITSFKVNFRNCPLTTTVDANAFMPLGEGATVQVNGFRVAPYDSEPEYQACELLPNGKDECQKMLVQPVWGQCGGAGGNCAAEAARLGQAADGFCQDLEWPYSECAGGAVCTRLDSLWWQCKL